MSIRKRYYGLFLAASIIYIAGTLAAPLTPNRFNLSTARTHVIQVAIALPVVLIWAVAIYGAEKFRSYSRSIVKHPDGKALDRVALGLSILIASTMIGAIFGILRPWAFKNGWLPAYTIAANYLAVILPIAAYLVMYKGSLSLLKLTKVKNKTIASSLTVVTILVAIAALYLEVLFNYDYRSTTPDPAKYSSFYLNDVAILLTVAVPYLIGWGMGIMACFNIGAYQRYVKGTIYKSALFRVVVGILWVTTFYILLQVLLAFSTYMAKAGLASLLLIIYLIILFYATGFLIIASGTRKLNAIEKAK